MPDRPPMAAGPRSTPSRKGGASRPSGGLRGPRRSAGSPRASRDTPRALRDPRRPSPRATSRRCRPRCDETRTRSLLRMIDTNADNGYGPFGSTFRAAGPKRFQEDSRMHENPRANEEEQELAQTSRMDEEEEQRSGYAPATDEDEDQAGGQPR